MPSISRFFGLVIYMYFNDHAPPYFHAEYGDWEAVYVIANCLSIRSGRWSRRGIDMNKLGPRVRVRAVQPLDGWAAQLTFENGVVRDIDLEPYLYGPIFAPIRANRTMFCAMKVEGGTIAWENGADIDPDVLYYNLTPAWMEQETVGR